MLLVAVAGCSSSSTHRSCRLRHDRRHFRAFRPTYADPAAQVAHEFLDAVVKGETARANSLLTPLAVERITASGKPFQLPGLANYTFRVGQVRRPAPDKAFVQCTGTDRTAPDKAVEEEFCWLMTLVDQDWRIAGISYSAGPQQTLMIYSFENPEKGAIPVQQLMAQVRRTNCRGDRPTTIAAASESPATRSARRREPRKKRFPPAPIARRLDPVPYARHLGSNDGPRVKGPNSIASRMALGRIFFNFFALFASLAVRLSIRQFCRWKYATRGSCGSDLRQDVGVFAKWAMC